MARRRDIKAEIVEIQETEKPAADREMTDVELRLECLFITADSIETIKDVKSRIRDAARLYDFVKNGHVVNDVIDFTPKKVV